MTPPEAPVTDPSGRSAGSAPAVSVCAQETRPSPTPARVKLLGRAKLVVMRKRADYLRAASALRQGAPGFLLQARRRTEGEPVPPDAVRVGFTCSKKVGNAVARNRAKRRLREIARLGLGEWARPGWDYVLIGRPGVTGDRDFAALQDDLRRAMDDIHSGRAKSGHRPGGAGKGRKGRG